MRIICDVHISFKVVNFFKERGIEAVHVNHILDGDITKDNDIIEYADEHGYTIMTKDADFQNGHLINNRPRRLIKVNLGNISTKKLLEILDKELGTINDGLDNQICMVEINNGFIRIVTRDV